MTTLSRLYKKYINGIILTLVFHIILFTILLLTHFEAREDHEKNDFLIDIPLQPIEQTTQSDNKTGTSANIGHSGQLKTNIASNKISTKQNNTFEDQYSEDIEQAQKLITEVKNQLTKEIPTIEGLKMPEARKANPEEMKDNRYTGESNIEYYLQNRYHLKLPIPVYLAEGGGKVKVNIIVDQSGNVIEADPVVEASHTTQILSYAKTAALRTKFNLNPEAPIQQKGYILYNFIPQN